MESLDGGVRTKGDVLGAEIASSEDLPPVIMSAVTDELYVRHVTDEYVAAVDADARPNDDDGRLPRSSSYEDIYVGTKLPGDEQSDDDEAGVIDVADIGDRFDSRPAATAVHRRQSGRRSSSFENLYETQRREAAGSGETENDSIQWQMKESSCEDLSEKDSMLAPFSGQPRRNSPIDITVESGLDRVGQSEEYSTTKRSPSHSLQHSMSYDVAERRLVLGSGSSLDGEEKEHAVGSVQRERNAAYEGIRNGCGGCTVCDV